MTITSDEIIAFAGLLGALAVIWGVVSKPFKAIQDMTRSVTEMTEDVAEIKKAVTLHGDMIAELLEHSIDGNNTGKMREVKKRFDDAYRHDLTA